MWHPGGSPGCLLLLPCSAVMVNGQVQQSPPEKGTVTKSSDPSALKGCVLPPGASQRRAQVLVEGEGNLEWRVEVGEDEHQCVSETSCRGGWWWGVSIPSH